MMTYEKRLLLSALRLAAENYIEQRRLLKDIVDTKFPELSGEYKESKGALMALIRICRELRIDGADMVEQMLEEEP